MKRPRLIGEDPAVTTWRIALAGDRRPQPPRRRHWWRDLVVEAWRAADDAWALERERVAVGYRAEQLDFEATHPRPQAPRLHVTPGRRPRRPRAAGALVSPATYGPHRPDDAPITVTVRGRGRYPAEEQRPTPLAVLRQRRQLNERAYSTVTQEAHQ